MHHRERFFQISDVMSFEASYYFRFDEKVYVAQNFPPHMHDMLELYVLVLTMELSVFNW